jgi:signal transduction histidine kinase
MGEIRVRSFLGVALEIGAGFVSESSGDKEKVGVLYIDFLLPHHFKKEEIQIAQMFANFAATAIAAARVYEHKLEIEKLAAVNTFGARFAHRVGNLLGTVPVNFAALERLLNSADGTTLKGHLDLLRDDVQKIQRILEAGRHLRRFGSRDHEPVIINEILREVLAQESIPSNVALSMELDVGVPPLQANKLALNEIFSDMIENALDAMPQGGRLKISTKLRAELHSIEIQISDTGVGIAPEVLQRLREPFFTTKEANLGLGVWLCHQTVEQMGGKLIIESPVNCGTTFTIQLPI